MKEGLKQAKRIQRELEHDMEKDGWTCWFPEDQKILDWLISEVESLQETLDWINEGEEEK